MGWFCEGPKGTHYCPDALLSDAIGNSAGVRAQCRKLEETKNISSDSSAGNRGNPLTRCLKLLDTTTDRLHHEDIIDSSFLVTMIAQGYLTTGTVPRAKPLSYWEPNVCERSKYSFKKISGAHGGPSFEPLGISVASAVDTVKAVDELWVKVRYQVSDGR
ncbi:hypothetical protein RUM43_005275 [Polyplax serrata]|uniref:Uncharacterized protein n=1 Tax=Polyplax serrata TaxID=468196 RepID=A0AAN8S8L3_POLSC